MSWDPVGVRVSINPTWDPIGVGVSINPIWGPLGLRSYELGPHCSWGLHQPSLGPIGVGVS